MQVFDKMAAILLALALCFLGPAGLIRQGQEARAELAVMEVAASCVEQWKQQGYITWSSYESVLAELSLWGSYCLELDYGQRVVEPDFSAGECVEAHVTVPQREIEETLERDGVFPMRQGDTLKIIIQPAGDTRSAGWLSRLYGTVPQTVIRYGGIVTGEWNESSHLGG